MANKLRPALYLIALAVVLLAWSPAYAQSKAKAPPLDRELKQFIAGMTLLAGEKPASLDDKIVVVTFFASWCPPCRPEFGHLNEVRQAFPKEDVVILAINLFEDFFKKGQKRRMMRFLSATRPEFSVLRAEDDHAVETKFGGVDRIPTVFIFDRTGKPIFTFIHQVDAEKTHATAEEVTAALRKITP